MFSKRFPLLRIQNFLALALYIMLTLVVPSQPHAHFLSQGCAEAFALVGVAR